MAKVMGVIGRVAAAATDQDSAYARADEVLDELKALIPFVAADFSAIDPVSGEHVQLARREYSDRTISALRDTRFVDTLDLLKLRASGVPTRIRDVPGDPLETWVIGEVLLPAGYREGLTMCLQTRDGRLTGVLNLSTESALHPSDDARQAMGMLCNVLGGVADLTQSNRWLNKLSGGSYTAVGIDSMGNVVSLEGALETMIFRPGGELLATVQKIVDKGIGGSFTWPADTAGKEWFRVCVVIVPASDENLAAIVTLDKSDVKLLSQRELEVLTMAAHGLSNREIATRLFISDRTVQTHVEHVLVKLSAPNRAAAAVIGAECGLLLGKVSFAY